MCFVLFFLNVIVFIFLSSFVVFMDYYTTIVEGCFEGGDGGCGGKGGAVGCHSQTRNKSCTSRAKVAIVRQTLVGPLLGWGDCTQANYLARVSLTN